MLVEFLYDSEHSLSFSTQIENVSSMDSASVKLL